ncbi:MAG TPA: hypothetical protein VIJ23_12070 [Mycobacterium sp.]
MDGSALVDELSDHAAEDVQKRLKDLHTRYYEASGAQLTVLPGARPLLQRVADSDPQVVRRCLSRRTRRCRSGIGFRQRRRPAGPFR